MDKEKCCSIYYCSCGCTVKDKVRSHVMTQFKSIDLLSLGWEANDRLAVQLNNGNQVIVTKGDIFSNGVWASGYFATVYFNSHRRVPDYVFSYPAHELGLEEFAEF